MSVTPNVPLFTADLFQQAMEARGSYARAHPDCGCVLRLANGDDLYVAEVRGTFPDGLVCTCLERGKDPDAYPVAIVPWSAILRVDLIDRLPWSGTPGFRPVRANA